MQLQQPQTQHHPAGFARSTQQQWTPQTWPVDYHATEQSPYIPPVYDIRRQYHAEPEFGHRIEPTQGYQRYYDGDNPAHPVQHAHSLQYAVPSMRYHDPNARTTYPEMTSNLPSGQHVDVGANWTHGPANTNALYHQRSLHGHQDLSARYDWDGDRQGSYIEHSGVSSVHPAHPHPPSLDTQTASGPVAAGRDVYTPYIVHPQPPPHDLVTASSAPSAHGPEHPAMPFHRASEPGQTGVPSQYPMLHYATHNSYDQRQSSIIYDSALSNRVSCAIRDTSARL